MLRGVVALNPDQLAVFKKAFGQTAQQRSRLSSRLEAVLDQAGSQVGIDNKKSGDTNGDHDSSSAKPHHAVRLEVSADELETLIDALPPPSADQPDSDIDQVRTLLLDALHNLSQSS